MRTLLRLIFVCLLAIGAPGRAAEPEESYPLDGEPRVLAPGSRLSCERGDVDLVTYRGTTLRYAGALRVHPAFVSKLEAFEQLARELALRTYGRPPRQVVHLGSYACRRMRRYPDWVSEHALGNALDLAGFDFGPLPRGSAAPDDLPKALRRGFSVRMERHWSGPSPHAAFLQALARALIARPDVFSVVLGPAWPGHHNHLHLDRAPYRVVEVFDAP